ncbi:MAG TPA: UDP-glucose 4-epimerase GalE, partial [Verrucomicrobiae bacterium]|nr:UDP-glucose 4-epimerase GalE [Verrucomicrobiae bacterium]
TGHGFTVREVIDTVRKVTGHPIPSREEPRRAGDPAVLVASSDKIKRELNWQPQYPELQDIVKSAWTWFQSHPNGYGPPPK